MEGVFAGVGDLGRQGKQVGLDALGAQACQERSVLSEDDDGSVAGGIEGVEQVKQSDLAPAQARRVIHIQDRTRKRGYWSALRSRICRKLETPALLRPCSGDVLHTMRDRLHNRPVLRGAASLEPGMAQNKKLRKGTFAFR